MKPAPTTTIRCRAGRLLSLRLRLVSLVAAAIVLTVLLTMIWFAVTTTLFGRGSICLLLAGPAVAASILTFPKAAGVVELGPDGVKVVLDSTGATPTAEFACSRPPASVSWEVVAVQELQHNREHMEIVLCFPQSVLGIRYTDRVHCGFDRDDFDRLYWYLELSDLRQGRSEAVV